MLVSEEVFIPRTYARDWMSIASSSVCIMLCESFYLHLVLGM